MTAKSYYLAALEALHLRISPPAALPCHPNESVALVTHYAELFHQSIAEASSHQAADAATRWRLLVPRLQQTVCELREDGCLHLTSS